MYRLMITIAALRAAHIVHAAPTCCGQPMERATGIGTNGWYCVVNPMHVRT